MKKKRYYVSVTLTFDPRSLISIGFEPVEYVTIQRKPRPNLFICSAGILFISRVGHTHTQINCSKSITPPRFRGCVINDIQYISFLDLDLRSRSKVTDVEVCAFSECFFISNYLLFSHLNEINGLYSYFGLCVCLKLCLSLCFL